MKKKLASLLLMLCMGLTSFAQTSKSETEDEVFKKLNTLANSLCECIIKIGSTDSGLSDTERDRIRLKVVPTLFIKYEKRIMKTTGGLYGNIIREKEMPDYFIALKNQSRKVLNRSRTYRVYPEIITNKDGIVWTHEKEYDDGSIQEYATIILHQIYELSFENSSDIGWKKHVEVDQKEIKVIRLKQDGEIIYGLGDVTNVERMETHNH